MKKIIILFIVLMLLSNTVSAGPQSGGTGNNNNDNGSSDNISVSDGGDSIEITVSAKEGTSDIRYETQGYHVTVFVDNHHGDENYNSIEWFTFYVELEDNGTTGDAIVHEIPIFADGSGFSIEEQAPDAQALVDALEMGRVDLQFNARIGILHGGEYYGEYYDEQTPLEAAYSWSDNAKKGFDTRFGVDLNLDPLYKNPSNDNPDGTPSDGGPTTIDGSATSVNVVYGGTAYSTIGSEQFDVAEGIPSGESCYVEVGCNQYLMNYVIGRYTGTYNVTVTVLADVTYRYSTRRFNSLTMSYEMDSEGNYIYDQVVETISLFENYSYSEPYTFYTVESLDIFVPSVVSVSNEAIGDVSLSPSGAYISPVVALDVYPSLEDHFAYNDFIYVGSIEVNGDTSTPVDLSRYAPSSLDFQVRNDGLMINGQNLMDDTYTSGIVPEPSNTVVVPFITSAFHSEGHSIETEMLNSEYESSATIEYRPIISVGSGNVDSSESVVTNSVFVHTPVVCDGAVNHDIAADQSLEIDEDYMSVVLGKATSFDLSTLASHRDIMGYGERDYATYTTSQQVRFPFDVYMNTDYREDGRYLKANTWCTLPFHMDTFQMYIPTWVDEGLYEVDFRTIAHNAPDYSMTEALANLDSSHYVATETVQVEVKGRLYGFTVTDIHDYPNWQSVFRVGNTYEHTDQYFYGGTMSIGGPDDIDADSTIPIIAGSHPSMTYEGPLKTGYGISFELETIGDYAGETDCISITPTFRYISYDGSMDIPVDLYYNEGNAYYFTKIGEGKNRQNTQYIKLGDPYRNVDLDTMEETASVIGTSFETFKTQSAKLGWYDWIVLSEPLRTFVGDDEDLPAGVDPVDVLTSVQHWYGEYHLPDEVYAAPLNYDVYGAGALDGHEDFWLHDGYIVVNFDIETIKDGDFDTPILSYGDGGSSMWNIEGYVNNKVDAYGYTFRFEAGDIVLYDLNHASSDDYIDGGTH